MWFTWNDFDRHFPATFATAGRGASLASDFGAVSDLWRQLDRGVRGLSANYGALLAQDGAATVVDTGQGFVFRVDVPGIRDEDLRLDVHEQTVTLTARREIKPREGYAALRNERQAFEWKKSFTLPAKIDTEKTAARLTDGVLEVRLAKAAGQEPRRVQIAAQ